MKTNIEQIFPEYIEESNNGDEYLEVKEDDKNNDIIYTEVKTAKYFKTEF